MVDSRESLRSALLAVVERHGMFVQGHRLDSLFAFFDGWALVAPVYRWDDDLEIHEWIFLRESVSFASQSLLGRSLVSLCYGNGREAIDQYKTLLGEVEFRSRADRGANCTIGEQVFGIWRIIAGHGTDQSGGYGGGTRMSGVLKQAAKQLIEKPHDTYEDMVPLMRRMVDEPHDELWAYLHTHGVLMARFLYRAEGGDWQDSTSLRDKDGYLENLLLVHAYAMYMGKTLKDDVVTVRYSHGVTSVEHEEPDAEKPLCVAYNEWSQRVRSL